MTFSKDIAGALRTGREHQQNVLFAVDFYHFTLGETSQCLKDGNQPQKMGGGTDDC